MKWLRRQRDSSPMQTTEKRLLIPSGVLYPLTITVDLLLVLDLIRLDPLPFVDEFVLIALGFFLNRSALRRLGWWPAKKTARGNEADDGQQRNHRQ